MFYDGTYVLQISCTTHHIFLHTFDQLKICADIYAIVYVMGTDYNLSDWRVPIRSVSPHYLMPKIRIMSLLFLDCIRS